MRANQLENTSGPTSTRSRSFTRVHSSWSGLVIASSLLAEGGWLGRGWFQTLIWADATRTGGKPRTGLGATGRGGTERVIVRDRPGNELSAAGGWEPPC